MQKIDNRILRNLYKPKKNSHKGQNGKLLVIGGSDLFHAASLWALETASRVVDMVFYASTPVNQEIVTKQKQKFREGIVVPDGKLDEYIKEADCVLIGPGMERGTETEKQVNELLKKYPEKKWVVDGGALQMMEKKLLTRKMIITPHTKEFKRVFAIEASQEQAVKMAKEHGCTIVLKGKEDVVCDETKCLVNQTGNEGMTKGGTGDVLAGLIAALYCKNKAMIAGSVGVYVNGLAGDRLYGRTVF